MSLLSVCTLYEGDHHFGVAALINSVIKTGFQGHFYVGYRGHLPYWADSSAGTSEGWMVSPGVTVSFVLQSTDEHMSHLKPLFMLDLLDNAASGSEGLVYFDTDIVARAPWSFFEMWVQAGVAMCSHERPLPVSHPFRKEWLRLGSTIGLELRNPITEYINGGFVGFLKSQRTAMLSWRRIMEAIYQMGVGKHDFQKLDSSHPWAMTDQAALNLVAMTTENEVSIIGGEGMDFMRQGSTMSHAAGGRKPWQIDHVREALRGMAPNKATLEWARFLDGPVRPYSPQQVEKIRKSLRRACFIGRFFRNENFSYYPPA